MEGGGFGSPGVAFQFLFLWRWLMQGAWPSGVSEKLADKSSRAACSVEVGDGGFSCSERVACVEIFPAVFFLWVGAGVLPRCTSYMNRFVYSIKAWPCLSLWISALKDLVGNGFARDAARTLAMDLLCLSPLFLG